MMAHAYVGLGFSIVATAAPTASGRTEVYRFECRDCTAALDIPRRGRGISPETVAQTARRKGWEADARRPSRARCRGCQMRGARARKPA